MPFGRCTLKSKRLFPIRPGDKTNRPSYPSPEVASRMNGRNGPSGPATAVSDGETPVSTPTTRRIAVPSTTSARTTRRNVNRSDAARSRVLRSTRCAYDAIRGRMTSRFTAPSATSSTTSASFSRSALPQSSSRRALQPPSRRQVWYAPVRTITPTLARATVENRGTRNAISLVRAGPASGPNDGKSPGIETRSSRSMFRPHVTRRRRECRIVHRDQRRSAHPTLRGPARPDPDSVYARDDPPPRRGVPQLPPRPHGRRSPQRSAEPPGCTAHSRRSALSRHEGGRPAPWR